MSGNPKKRTGVRVALLALGALAVIGLFRTSAAQQTQNLIQSENARAGTSAWQLNNSADNQEIEGYANLTSVNRGGAISFYVNTNDSAYTIEVFRMGWYGGLGGRRETAAGNLAGNRPDHAHARPRHRHGRVQLDQPIHLDDQQPVGLQRLGERGLPGQAHGTGFG